MQFLVKALMRTLLTGLPSLLSDAEKNDLANEAYCKTEMKLQISNLALIRKKELGKEINGRSRYWKDTYGDFYVCSQWWKRYHCVNARSLLAFVEDVIRRNPERKDTMRPHAQAFRSYLEKNCA